MATLETLQLVPTEAVSRQISRWVSIGTAGAAVFLGLVALYHVNRSPRTDDAEVFANFIGMAPQVEGPIIRLNVRDNQFVK
jgi:membrane fusion protein, multidrug efflux system